MKFKKPLQNSASSTDEDLYIAWCQGNQEAARALVQRHQSQILLIALRYSKNKEVAKDITQNVWIEICKKAKYNFEIKSFKAFIYVVCRNKYLDLFRKNKNSKETSSAPNELPDHQLFSLENQITQQEDVRISKQIILTLPPLQKECYMLYVFDELSMEEIALQLQISVNQVRGRIDRAKKRMKNYKNKIL